MSLRPVDVFTIAYLAFGLVLLVFFPGRPENAPLLALLHALGIAAIVLARRFRLDRTAIGGLLLDFYPLPLFGLFYTEAGILNRILHPDAFFDAALIRFEEEFFGNQPSQDLHRSLPWLPLGEYLHAGYLSYYFLVPVVAFSIRFGRGRLAYDRAVASIALAFYISFLFFVAIPVKGPYHVFTADPPAVYGYWMPKAARWIVDRGSSIGTAFPSSHVSVATATWIMAMRYHRPVAVVYLFLVPALAVGAVYGGFHYATDIAAGALLGILAGTLGHALAVKLSQGTRRALALGPAGGAASRKAG